MESSDEEVKAGGPKSSPNFRFYRQRFPKINDLVMVEVKYVDQVGAKVLLLEYNNIEGLIMLGEMSKKRIRSVTKLTRVGRKEVVIVIRVDESKGYLDLSKKQVTPDDIKECETNYNKAKSVSNILWRVSQMTNKSIEELYETIGWPLYDKYEHALDAFKLAIIDSSKNIFEGLQTTPEVIEALLKVIRTRLTPPPIKIRADFSVTCFEYEGIDAIKAALKAGTETGNKEIEVKIRLIAAPHYVMILTTQDKNVGLNLANASLKRISEEIKARGGNYMIKENPQVLNANDNELEEMIHKQNNINRVISDIEEGSDEGMGDVDIGIDIAEIDAKNAAEKYEEDDEDERKDN